MLSYLVNFLSCYHDIAIMLSWQHLLSWQHYNGFMYDNVIMLSCQFNHDIGYLNQNQRSVVNHLKIADSRYRPTDGRTDRQSLENRELHSYLVLFESDRSRSFIIQSMRVHC
jgi:hypothetical protein